MLLLKLIGRVFPKTKTTDIKSILLENFAVEFSLPLGLMCVKLHFAYTILKCSFKPASTSSNALVKLAGRPELALTWTVLSAKSHSSRHLGDGLQTDRWTWVSRATLSIWLFATNLFFCQACFTLLLFLILTCFPTIRAVHNRASFSVNI